MAALPAAMTVIHKSDRTVIHPVIVQSLDPIRDGDLDPNLVTTELE